MLVIATADLKILIDAAEAAYPAEACALLVGRRGFGDARHVTRVELAANVADDTRRRFEVDPGLRIGLERELRGGPLSLLGVWHSHPDGPAEPSATDAAMVYEPELAWAVTAVNDGEAVATNVFVPVAGGFRAIPLRLI